MRHRQRVRSEQCSLTPKVTPAMSAMTHHAPDTHLLTVIADARKWGMTLESLLEAFAASARHDLLEGYPQRLRVLEEEAER